MITKNEISLDLGKPGVLPRVYAVQGEADCRAVLFTLYENGAPWDGPAAPEVTMSYRRADGSGGYIDTDGSGNAAVMALGGIVTLLLTQEICSEAGPVMVTAELTEENTVLATWPLCVEVVANPGMNALDGVLTKGPWDANRQLFTDGNGRAVALEGYRELDLTALAALPFDHVEGMGGSVAAALSEEDLQVLAAGTEIRPLRVKLLTSTGSAVWAVLPSRFAEDKGFLYSGVMGNPTVASYVSIFLRVLTDGTAQLNFYPNQLGAFVRTVNGAAPDADGNVTVAGGSGGGGVTFTPAVDEQGVLSWSNNGGLLNPDPVDLTGPQGPEGPAGADGSQGPAGADGITPIKGTDYFTEADKAEMTAKVLDNIPRATHISVDRRQSITTMNLTMNDGTASAVRIEYGANGDPTSITVDGEQITLEFLYHTMQLFLNGNTYLDNSGGWTASSKAKGTVTEQKTPTLDVSADMTISLSTDKNSAQGSVISGHTILYPENWSKLCFVVKSLSSGGKVTFGLTADKSGSTYTMAKSQDAALGLNEISLTDISAGDHCIAIAVTAYADQPVSVVIESIYLE